MILSKYLNPPYRSPLSNNSSVSTSTHPPQQFATRMQNGHNIPQHSANKYVSPSKRKHDDLVPDRALNGSAPSLFVVRLDPLDDEAPARGAESPRSKVAERLRGLALSSSHPGPQYQSDDSDGERKKPRRGASFSPSPRKSDSSDATTPSPSLYRFSPYPSKPFSPPSPSRGSSTSSPPSSKRRLSSPPPPLSFGNASSANGANGDDASSSSHHPTKSSPSSSNQGIPSSSSPFSSPPSSLTWQPAEITGHLVDPRNPDDDGEGINGVGFRPSAAVAYARSQRRKQQVSEWRLREAREARQRRFEKRRGWGGGGGGNGGGGGGGGGSDRGSVVEAGSGKGRGRVVRFAGGS